MSGGAWGAEALLRALEQRAPAPISIVAGVDSVTGAPDLACAHADAQSLFELGSITKTMTAQVLASLVGTGRVALDDQIGTWLDAGRNADITLGELATHTSGLPRMGPNAIRSLHFRPSDPHAHYTAERAEKGLRKATVRGRGTSAYSNFGFQILGLALERAADAPLADLLVTHVFEPFRLATISVGPHPELVQGFTGGRAAKPWHSPLLGPGGLVGTIEDLLRWGRAVLDPPTTPEGDALRLALEPRADDPAGSVSLAWHHTDGVVWHNGGTAGFHSCLAIDVSGRRIAASLVASGGLVDGLDSSTILAARGLDPAGPAALPADGSS